MWPAVVLGAALALGAIVAFAAADAERYRCPGCGADLAGPTVACECGVGYSRVRD